ncbi:MAG: amidohydrolase family protein [Thermaerobacter sp.]|nr:amidohydrolase family protein [Thermaerobacter sp.]
MPTPRIAVSQAPYLRDADAALARALTHMRQAVSRGVDVIVFPEWFMGLNPVEVIPNRLTERLSQCARELNVTVVTGSLRTLEPETGKKQQRGIVIERDGTLAGSQAKLTFHPTERPWFEPGTGLSPIATRWGRIAVLLGLDAVDPDLWTQVGLLKPDLVVMAVSPRTAAEKTHLHELTVTRSLELHGSVVLSPLTGRFSGTLYLGGALIAQDGRILSLTEDGETVLMASDPEAPLIQLGVTDVSCYVPLAPALKEWAVDPKQTLGPEGERKVILDWGALRAPNLLAAGRDLLALANDNPRWAALAPARPHGAQELTALLEAGASGAYAYPGLDRVLAWADSVRELGKTLVRYRRPLLVHTGPGPAPLRFDSPALWDEFLQEFPTVPLVLLHMGLRSPYLEEAMVLAERHPQVLLETSGTPVPAIREALASLGPERVVFGSGGLAREFTPEWNKMQTLAPDLSPESFERVMNQNARHLFFRTTDGLRTLPEERVGSLQRLS